MVGMAVHEEVVLSVCCIVVLSALYQTLYIDENHVSIFAFLYKASRFTNIFT